MKLQSIIPFGLFLLAFSISACTSNSIQTDIPDEDSSSNQNVTTIQVDNMGATAYVVLGIDGEGASATLDEENTEIALRIGDRFNFENEAGASNHPLNFRNSDQDKLLGQSNDEGMFDTDSEVDVQTDGNTISFTLTEALAAELNGYVCSFHPDMNGEITTTE